MTQETVFVHEQIVTELNARRTALMTERATLLQAAARLEKIDALVAALDQEIGRSTDTVSRLTATFDESTADAYEAASQLAAKLSEPKVSAYE